MLKERSHEKELMDDFNLQNDALRTNLQELQRYNRWLGGKKVLLDALQMIYHCHAPFISSNPIVIADLCCGGGDLLLYIAQWTKLRQLRATLIGVDANPFMLEFAKETTRGIEHINYQVADIFSPQFQKQTFDIVCLNSVTHHFSDKEMVTLLTQLVSQTRCGIIINDLQRHWISYYTVKCLTYLFNFSYLFRHDAPLSVRKAFRKQELQQILAAAKITHYHLVWRWPFRWQLVIINTK